MLFRQGIQEAQEPAESVPAAYRPIREGYLILSAEEVVNGDSIKIRQLCQRVAVRQMYAIFVI